MHRPAHGLVAAEGEGDVGQPRRRARARQRLLDPAERLDEGDAVAVVLGDAGGDREDVGVEDDVLGREADRLGQQLVGAGADIDLALDRLGLAGLVEGHDHDRRAVAQDAAGLVEERLLALLEADRVDHGLALDVLQPGLDHRPLRRIDHDRHPADVRLRANQAQEADHRRLGLEHALVHVDVDDLGAVLDLLAGDIERGLVVALDDQPAEPCRAGDVGAFADGDEALGSESVHAASPPPSGVRGPTGAAPAPPPRPHAAARPRRPRRSRGYGPGWCRSNRRRC